MERIYKASRQARRRRLLADSVNRLGVALCVALGIGLLAVLISRLIGEPIDWRWAALPPVIVGVAFALLDAWRRRLTELEAATDVDTTLSLRDRLGSSIELETLNRDDPFVQLLERDADEAAGKVNIAAATPIRFGNSWLAWPALAGLLVVAVLFMPTLDLLGRQQAAQQKAQEESRVEEASNTIEEIIQETEDNLARLDPESEDELPGLMDEIQKQLEEGDLTPEEAEAQIAAALEEKSQELQQQAEQAQQMNEMLEEMLAESADPDNMDASELEQALESGDFDAAAEALEKLKQELGDMTEEQRQAMSESMQQMAERLSQAADNKMAQNNAQEQIAQQLQQMGMSKEMAEQLAQNGDAQQMAEQLQKQGMSAADAQKLAEQMAQQKSNGECQNGASRSAKSLAEAMKQAGKGAGEGQPGEMGELGEMLDGMSDAEMEAQLAELTAGNMQGQAQGMMNGNGGGLGGNKAGEGSGFNEQVPTGLGKSLTTEIENRRGGGEGEVAMRYTRKRPVEWDESTSTAPMREAQFREAAEASEQAIEEQAISPRYRGGIREYFERTRKVAPPADESPAPAKPADGDSK